MIRSEAIRVLESERKDHHSYPTDLIGQAEQLGIEAMKYLEKWHQDLINEGFNPLPGETEE